jgi:hypothetical protein
MMGTPEQMQSIGELIDSLGTLQAVIEASISLGGRATTEAVLAIAKGLVPSPSGTVLRAYLRVLSHASGTFSGTRLYTTVVYEECDWESCCLIWSRLDWQDAKEDGPKVCAIGAESIIEGEPPVYGSPAGALQALPRCLQEHKDQVLASGL